MTYYQINKKWTNAKKQVYNGIKYDSKFEAGQAMELETLKRAGEILDFMAHKKMALEVNGYLICNYYVDFEVKHKDGTIEYIETKGWASPIFNLKWKLFEALTSKDPNIKLTLIKQGR